MTTKMGLVYIAINKGKISWGGAREGYNDYLPTKAVPTS
jgi:hypothetical protein